MPRPEAPGGPASAMVPLLCPPETPTDTAALPGKDEKDLTGLTSQEEVLGEERTQPLLATACQGPQGQPHDLHSDAG